MKLSKAIEGYSIAFLADGRSAETLKGYKWAFDRLVTFTGDKDVQAVTGDDLRGFMAYLSSAYQPTRANGDKSPLSNSSLVKVWAILRSFYNWAAQEFSLSSRPDSVLRQPKATPKVIIPFTEDEVKRLLKVTERTRPTSPNVRKSYTAKRPTAERDTAIILTLLDTGLRVSELARLHVGDADLVSGQVVVKSIGSGVKSKSRVVYLGKTSRRALWRYLAKRGDDDARKDDPLFVTERGRQMDRNSIRLVLSKLGQRAGVHCNPHKFRHTFSIEFLRNGGNVFELQQLLGHSSLEMVKLYARLAQVDIAEAHRRASPADRWRL